jgi:hypothetical protein
VDWQAFNDLHGAPQRYLGSLLPLRLAVAEVVWSKLD